MKRLYTLTMFLVFTLCLSAQENKPSIAVFDCLSESTSADKDTRTAVREIISSTIVNTHEYDVVERVLLEQVMKEQGFQYSGIVDEEQITEIGKITGAETIILPILTSPSYGNTYILSIKMLNVKTGNIERQEVDSVPHDLAELLKKVEEMTSNLLSSGTNVVIDF